LWRKQFDLTKCFLRCYHIRQVSPLSSTQFNYSNTKLIYFAILCNFTPAESEVDLRWIWSSHSARVGVIIWYNFTDVSEERTTFIFSFETTNNHKT
jgi:hypothetical protein